MRFDTCQPPGMRFDDSGCKNERKKQPCMMEHLQTSFPQTNRKPGDNLPLCGRAMEFFKSLLNGQETLQGLHETLEALKLWKTISVFADWMAISLECIAAILVSDVARMYEFIIFISPESTTFLNWTVCPFPETFTSSDATNSIDWLRYYQKTLPFTDRWFFLFLSGDLSWSGIPRWAIVLLEHRDVFTVVTHLQPAFPPVFSIKKKKNTKDPGQWSRPNFNYPVGK